MQAASLFYTQNNIMLWNDCAAYSNIAVDDLIMLKDWWKKIGRSARIMLVYIIKVAKLSNKFLNILFG